MSVCFDEFLKPEYVNVLSRQGKLTRCFSLKPLGIQSGQSRRAIL